MLHILNELHQYKYYLSTSCLVIRTIGLVVSECPASHYNTSARIVMTYTVPLSKYSYSSLRMGCTLWLFCLTILHVIWYNNECLYCFIYMYTGWLYVQKLRWSYVNAVCNVVLRALRRGVPPSAHACGLWTTCGSTSMHMTAMHTTQTSPSFHGSN